MNLFSSNYTGLHFHPVQHRKTLFFPHDALLQPRQFQLGHCKKRRRLRRALRLVLVHSCLLSPFDALSLPSLDSLAPAALGLASAVALYLSSWFRKSPRRSSDVVGEWILFTSPTPFNRFVILRCPSVSFEGSKLLEDVNDKLVKEDSHFVRLNTGVIQACDAVDVAETGGLEFQRVYISAEDGGVISLDWPAYLDLEEEHGLDTTLLLVPGTAEGSMDSSVQSFVREALKCGLFPVVMNPRGCAGSLLTTARLFTAADSDDICTAIKYINKARPWTTLMGVGWGYGANMLTKYLSEVGERTPVTAAVSIDNPFDLEEATRCSPHHIALDQKLASGLVDILRSNKEIFQGRAKGFDVEKALSAKSVCEFEQAISMVSYGFEAIEDFYSKSSTRGVVGRVKIPVLCIQNDDGAVPLFSLPRGLIAENPFTSLLLCSCSPSSVIGHSRAAISWCQTLTIEWLTAVELGLLKGRHPLLKDVDIAINPSKGLSLVEGIASGRGGKVKEILNLTQSKAVKGHSVDPIPEMLEDSDTAISFRFRPRGDLHKNMEVENKRLQQLDNVVVPQANFDEAERVQENEGAEDTQRGQVLQTAQVIMNVLDMTMPGTLREEDKKKVLDAIDQGETVLNALQDAVPENVRGKLTAAVSAILHAQGRNLKLDRFLDISRIHKRSAGSRPKTQEQAGGPSNAADLHKDSHSSDQKNRLDDLVDGADDTQPTVDKPAGGMGSELHAFENQQKSGDAAHVQSSNHQGDSSSSTKRSSNESGINNENDEFIKEKAASPPDSIERDTEADFKASITSRVEKIGGSEGVIINEHSVDQDVGAAQPGKREENEEKSPDSSDQNKTVSVNVAEEASLLGSPSEPQPVDREGTNHQKKDNGNSLPTSDQDISTVSDSNPPTFSVSQALDALTGIDDSTQVAVNSVFGVIENMISQLEDEKDDKNDDDEKIDSVSEKQQIANDHMDNEEVKEKDHFDGSHGTHLYDFPKNKKDSRDCARTGWMEEEYSQDSILYNENDADGSHGKDIVNKLIMERKNKDHFLGTKLLANYSDRWGENIPSYINVNPYRDSVNFEYFREYLLSKMQSAEPLDLDTTTALLLDYYPEEGQWKLLEQPGSLEDPIDDVRTSTGGYGKISHSPLKSDNTDSFIEPSYVILDAEKHQEPVEGYKMIDHRSENVENDEDGSEELMNFVKAIILDSLKVEIDRRVSASDMRGIKSELARDLEKVANAVSLGVGCDLSHTKCFESKDICVYYNLDKVGPLNGGSIIRAISSAILRTSYLRRVLPVGVIVGSSLAGLRKIFHVSAAHENDQHNIMALYQTERSGGKNHDKINLTGTVVKAHQKSSLNTPVSKVEKETGSGNANNESVMIGAVTAALGASALLVQQQATDPQKDEETNVGSSRLKEKGNIHKEPDKIEEVVSEKNPNNIVTSLAEKAMSVAGPVVPTKEDGEVDQERLVAMLADLGQKGGVLRLVGKIALLWGGLRGAMSLTDRLILFLRIAECPLFQRILGFVSMVLVLWSPVVVPLIPTLVRSWTANDSSRIAELACIIGLYTAVMILVMLWGKRIRGYENPLKQYGLDFTSAPKIQGLLKGMIGGIMVVLLIQSINVLIGCVSFSWPSSLLSLSTTVSLKVYGQMIMLTGQGIITATGIVLVEELLFRSWLPEEIAADLGYHRGIIISGLAFSIFQRSLRAIPGLWLLSLALAGARQCSKGSLFIPIGLRTGIMASSFILQTGGFLIHNLNFPLWVTGTHPFEPFSGIVGLTFSLLLAIILYPRQPLERKKFR